MGQYLIFINCDLQVSSHHLGKLGEWSDDDKGLSQTIVAHYIQPFSSLIEENECLRCARVTCAGDLGAFRKLPVELIRSIAQEMTYHGSIGLGITNSQLLSIVYPIIAMKTQAWWSTFSWAHCRIIYLGSECKDPLPPTCLPDNLKKRLENGADELDLGDSYSDEEDDEERHKNLTETDRLFCLGSSNAFKHAHMTWPSAGLEWHEYSFFLLYHHHRAPPNIPWSYHRASCDLAFLSVVVAGPDFITEYAYFSSQERQQYILLRHINQPPAIGDHVLINETKKEFIKEGHGVVFKWALLPLMIFAGDEQVKTVGINPHGPWAGDRIAIISSEDFAARMDDQWKDAIATGLKAQQDWVKFIKKYNDCDIDIYKD
ncbi:hypothetical protein ONZ45_g11895 [Pleurotus djamor]|nr:hypothetical protein ONZ45_g11895 [Pleurotus djamor]